jgi:hypothetical protein
MAEMVEPIEKPPWFRRAPSMPETIPPALLWLEFPLGSGRLFLK